MVYIYIPTKNDNEEVGEPDDMLSWPATTFLDVATRCKLVS